MFFSLLAASADGFIAGFVAGSAGVKFRFYDFVKTFVIIFICCLSAAVTGCFLGQTQFVQYINISGMVIMLALACNSFTCQQNNADNHTSVRALALAVAMDAAVVCIYLAMSGYNLWAVSFIGALLHSILMIAGSHAAVKVVRDQWIIYTRYITGMIFLLMAFGKAINL